MKIKAKKVYFLGIVQVSICLLFINKSIAAPIKAKDRGVNENTNGVYIRYGTGFYNIINTVTKVDGENTNDVTPLNEPYLELSIGTTIKNNEHETHDISLFLNYMSYKSNYENITQSSEIMMFGAEYKTLFGFDKTKLFLGLGVAFIDINIKLDGYNYFYNYDYGYYGSYHFNEKDNDAVFAMITSAGVIQNITERTSLELSMRYFSIPPEFEFKNTSIEMNIKGFSFGFNLRHNFWI
jgi:hypothetical protein